MDVRPDRLGQFLLAENAPRAGDKQRQHVEGLAPELDRVAVCSAQFGALRIEFKTSKTEHRPSPRSCNVPLSDRKLSMCWIELKISEKFQNAIGPDWAKGPADEPRRRRFWSNT